MRSWHGNKTPFGSWHASGGSAFSSNRPLLLTRSTAAWSQDLSGNLFAFGVDERRLTNSGLTITGAATRLHGEAPTNGSNNGNTSSALSAEGLFNPLRAISAGATSHRRVTPAFSITNGTPVYIRARVRAGSSPSVRIVCRNAADLTQSAVTGAFSSPSVTESAAGAISALVNKLMPNGDREFTFTWTPNATVANTNLGIGPDSATSGQTIDIIGMQATSQFSEWIMGGAGTVAQAADVATLDLTGVSMAAGFMLRLDGTVLATPRVTFDRFYQADNDIDTNRHTGYVNVSGGQARAASFVSNVAQADVTLSAALPGVFSLVGAHGQDYVGGAYNGVVATPDLLASYVIPTIVRIGSNNGGSNLPLLLTRITLFPETPTTARVTAVSA